MKAEIRKFIVFDKAPEKTFSDGLKIKIKGKESPFYNHIIAGQILYALPDVDIIAVEFFNGENWIKV